MNKEDIRLLEEKLVFSSFTHYDAYAIANSIFERVKREKLRRIGIRVTIHGVVVFQYLMDGKEEDRWLKRKQRTVEELGHSGYYLFLENEESHIYQKYENDEKYVICGGGFPICVNGENIGVFCISGLSHEQDHQLIVDAFEQYLSQEENKK